MESSGLSWNIIAKLLPIFLCLVYAIDWTSLTVKIYSWYEEAIEKGDPRLSDWPLMSSPFPTIFLTLAYLYFVKVAGPRWMKNREPFDLRTFMIFYNFFLVIISLVMFIEMGKLIEWGRYSFYCQAVDYSTDPIPMRMCVVGWYFFLSKFVEFMDTIIFVLRKKDRQITSLHVFHHSVVPITLWIGMKYAPGGNNAFFPFLNSGVHTVMYLYYGLSAFGPRFQKYLWWKKYLTKLQLAQFTLALAHGTRALFQDCEFPRSFVFLNIFHAVTFFYLFFSFYKNSYERNRKSGKGVEVSVSASSGPDGASTYARFGDVTITASVHYRNSGDECRQFAKSSSKDLRKECILSQ